MSSKEQLGVDHRDRPPLLTYWLLSMLVVFGLGYWISSLLPILHVPFTPFQTWRARLVLWFIRVVEITPLVGRRLWRTRFQGVTEPKGARRWFEAIALAGFSYWLGFFAFRWMSQVMFSATGPLAEPLPWNVPVSVALDVLGWWLVGMLYFGWLYRNSRTGARCGLVLATWPLLSRFVMVPALNLLPGINVAGRQANALSVGLLHGLLQGALFAGSDLLAWTLERRRNR